MHFNHFLWTLLIPFLGMLLSVWNERVSGTLPLPYKKKHGSMVLYLITVLGWIMWDI